MPFPGHSGFGLDASWGWVIFPLYGNVRPQSPANIREFRREIWRFREAKIRTDENVPYLRSYRLPNDSRIENRIEKGREYIHEVFG